MTAVDALERPSPGFVHEALLYQGTADAVAQLASFIRNGLESGESTLVAIQRSKAAALRDALGAASHDLTFVDMEEVGRNPGRIIAVWQDWLAAHPGRNVRGIGEPVWPERSRDELVECAAHERLLNLACKDSLLWLVCPYDAAGLSPDALTVAHDSHPHVITDGKRDSGAHVPDSWDDVFTAPLDEPAAVVIDMPFGDAISDVRQVTGTHALAVGIPADRAQDMVLAVSEVAANSLIHGSGEARFRAWRDNGSLVAEVRDAGRITDPLIGRTLPDATANGGRGLFIAHQLCDLVQVRSGETGTIVRLHMRVPTS